MIENPNVYSENKVYRPTRVQEELVAQLNFPDLKSKLIRLTEEQANYLGINPNGPYKREDYRY
jgi:adenosylhomocysteinase